MTAGFMVPRDKHVTRDGDVLMTESAVSNSRWLQESVMGMWRPLAPLELGSIYPSTKATMNKLACLLVTLCVCFLLTMGCSEREESVYSSLSEARARGAIARGSRTLWWTGSRTSGRNMTWIRMRCGELSGSRKDETLSTRRWSNPCRPM